MWSNTKRRWIVKGKFWHITSPLNPLSILERGLKSIRKTSILPLLYVGEGGRGDEVQKNYPLTRADICSANPPLRTSQFFGLYRQITCLLLALIILLTACETVYVPPQTAPTLTAPPIIKQLATPAPTLTPDSVAMVATQQANAPTPIRTATPTPTITPYIGVFLGEIVQESNIPNPANFIIPPTPINTIPLICGFEADPVFGREWQTDHRNALKCPIQERFGFNGRGQVFEGGAMYFRFETNEVWAIAPGSGTFSGLYWYEGQPNPSVVPGASVAPAGRFIPSGFIGSVWASIAPLQQALGLGLLPEGDSAVNVQRFDGGSLFLDVNAGQVFVLLLDGTAYGPYAP